MREKESAHANEFRAKMRRFAGMLSCAVLASGVFVSLAPEPRALAQNPQPADSKGIEGDWVRTDLAGSGSFGGLSDKFKTAQLTPAGERMLASSGRPPTGPAYTEDRVHKPGDPYIVVEKPCGAGGPFAGGGLGVNPDSNAIHIVQQKDEVVIAPERNGVRRIYIDGRRQADVSKWTPTGSGHGVGHYEGKVLVADTVGLAPGAVPAGGYRTPETHLTERFEVSPNGQHLTIHYTYSDPKIYVTPHSYDYTFDRLPTGSYAFEDWCDASDPHERESITIPEQK